MPSTLAQRYYLCSVVICICIIYIYISIYISISIYLSLSLSLSLSLYIYIYVYIYILINPSHFNHMWAVGMYMLAVGHVLYIALPAASRLTVCKRVVDSEPDQLGIDASWRGLMAQSMPCKNEKMECKCQLRSRLTQKEHYL